MDKKKLYNFLMFVPFALSIGSFILYFRYLFEVKLVDGVKVNSIIEASMLRYRNIGIFCLAVGVFLLFIKTLLEYLKIDNEVKTNDINNDNTNGLDKISTKYENNNNYDKEIETKKKTYSEDDIVRELFKDRKLKLLFYNSDINEKNVIFKNINYDKNIIEFYDTDEHIVKNNNINEIKKEEKIVMPTKAIKNDFVVDNINFKKCPKCNNILSNDAPICVHCGKILNKPKKKFNILNLIVNILIIILCLFLIFLVYNKIVVQSNVNKTNMNIKTVDTK